MRIDFSGDLFGIEDGAVESFSAKFDTQFTDGRFRIDCQLGDCGSTATIEDDGATLAYSIEIVDLHNQGSNKTIKDTEVYYSRCYYVFTTLVMTNSSHVPVC